MNLEIIKIRHFHRFEKWISAVYFLVLAQHIHFNESYISAVSSYTCNVIGCYYGGGVAYVDTANNQVWLRSATSADGTNSSSYSNMDFVMLSFFWTEDTGSLTERHVFTPTAESIVTGTAPDRCSQCAVDNTNGVEIGGGWQALLLTMVHIWVLQVQPVDIMPK
jgi:hypothetical protein